MLAQKDFSALTRPERDRVLAEMPQEEYSRLRELLLAARNLDAAARPPAHLGAQLRAHMKAQAPPKGFARLLALNIPAWQAAAALAVCLAATTFWQKEKIVENTITQWQVKTDTIWQEKIRWHDRIVVRERIVFQEKTPEKTVAYAAEPIDSQLVSRTLETEDLTPPHIGTSLGDAPELIDFFSHAAADGGR